MSKATVVVATAVLLLASTACDDDDDDLSMAEVSGFFTARGDIGSLVVTEGSTSEDILDDGGFLDITLNSDGTTEGTLFVPGGADDGTDLFVELDGLWSLEEDDDEFFVDVDSGSDAFIDDVRIVVADLDRLTIDDFVGDLRVAAVLVRSTPPVVNPL